jgi:hypothetical protein
MSYDMALVWPLYDQAVALLGPEAKNYTEAELVAIGSATNSDDSLFAVQEAFYLEAVSSAKRTGAPEPSCMEMMLLALARLSSADKQFYLDRALAKVAAESLNTISPK